MRGHCTRTCEHLTLAGSRRPTAHEPLLCSMRQLPARVEHSWTRFACRGSLDICESPQCEEPTTRSRRHELCEGEILQLQRACLSAPLEACRDRTIVARYFAPDGGGTSHTSSQGLNRGSPTICMRRQVSLATCDRLSSAIFAFLYCFGWQITFGILHERWPKPLRKDLEFRGVGITRSLSSCLQAGREKVSSTTLFVVAGTKP